MAKYLPGPLAGQISGGVGNTVFTRGRYGSVIRIGVMPVAVFTPYTVAVRGRLSTLSKAWQALTDAQRAAWETWAGQNPITDSLGQSQILQGNAAFIKLNARILMVAGTQVDLPPVAAPPASIGGTTSLTAQAPNLAAIAWASGALGATEHLVGWLALVNSAGRRYYKNALKMAFVSAAAATTPQAAGASGVLRFGTLIESQILYAHCYVVDNATGLISGVKVLSDAVAAAA